MSQFLEDVVKGLSSKEKYLESKYFYDAKGDELFQNIMSSGEYYPTRCEMEIFTEKTVALVNILASDDFHLDVIELGAGDASKSVHLLKALSTTGCAFDYYPVDISANVISYLQSYLPGEIPGLKLHGLNGEYFSMLEKAATISAHKKVVLFLGSNIGNVSQEKAASFCKTLRSHLHTDDLALIGFDLKKDPRTVLDAYNDKTGHTANFNLNLLNRINTELGGNFDLGKFYHYPMYDPQTGACKSFLVSSEIQQVTVGESIFSFANGETVFMEISQKYSLEQIGALAIQSGFKPIDILYDSRKWFVDVIWKAA